MEINEKIEYQTSNLFDLFYYLILIQKRERFYCTNNQCVSGISLKKFEICSKSGLSSGLTLMQAFITSAIPTGQWAGGSNL